VKSIFSPQFLNGFSWHLVTCGVIDLAKPGRSTFKRLQEQSVGAEQAQEAQLDRVLCRPARKPKHLHWLRGMHYVLGLGIGRGQGFADGSDTTDRYGNLQVLAKQFAADLFSEAQQQPGGFGAEREERGRQFPGRMPPQVVLPPQKSMGCVDAVVGKLDRFTTRVDEK